MDKLAYSPAEVAKILGIGRTTVYILIDQGRFKPVKVGRRTLIPANDLNDLLRPSEAA